MGTRADYVLTCRIFILLKPSDHFTYQQSWHSKILHGAHIAFMCSVRASKQTSTFTLYTINRLVLCNWGRKCLLRGTGQLKCDGTRAETRFRLSAKRTSPFKLRGASVQSTAGSRGVRISGSNANTPCSEVVRRVLTIHSILQFPLHFPSRSSPCVIPFQLDSTRWIHHVPR